MSGLDYLSCPRCSVPLDSVQGGAEVACGGCGSVFPFKEGFVDFVDPLTLEEFASWQRDIYDGLVESAHMPDYTRPEVVRRHLEYCVNVAMEHGALMPSWLGLKCREVTDTLAPREGELLLDVGCSTGIMLAMMSAVYGLRGVGVDFSAAAVASAAACSPGGSTFFSADALHLPFADETFDLAVSYGVIEHVTDHAGMVSEMARVLKPGGRVLIYTTCRRDRWTWHWWQRITSLGRYDLGVDNQAGHERDNFLEPDELARLLGHAGLGRVDTAVVHTMYTLMFDEVFPGFFNRILANPALLRAARRLLDTADALPNGRGYGNEFLATAWKG